MRIGITGGLGFIGRACVPRFLERGCREIRVLDSLEPSVHGAAPDVASYTRDWGNEVAVTIGSITDPTRLAELVSGVDAILHLASLTSVPGSMSDSALYTETNITGTARLRDALLAEASPIRVVLVSSRAVYGEGPYRCPNGCAPPLPGPVTRSLTDFQQGRWDPTCPDCGKVLRPLPAPESAALQPVSVYGLTKLAQEQLLQNALELRPFELPIFRLQNVYGPGQSRAVPDVGVANILAERILRGETVSLFEDGEPTRDFVYIDDVAELLVGATLDALGGERCEVFNVGTGVGVSLRELAETLFRCAGLAPSIRISGEYRLGDVRHSVADTTRLARARGGCPTPVEDGLAQLVDRLRTTSRGT